MPLSLGGVETARAQLVLWDTEVEQECVEAQATIESLCAAGFRIQQKHDGHVRLVPPPRGEDIGCFRILSQNGDDRVIWDRTDKNQVKEAFQKFKELLDKGYTAYVTKSDGSRGHAIKEFNPGLEEIILGATKPDGTKEPAKEVVCVPKTRPG